MDDNLTNRRSLWIPPARPDWVTRINDEGKHLDLKAVIPLDAKSLIATAVANTGLTNFGSDDWREPFELICRSLDSEAELNLMGRMMTRSDMVMLLEGRLEIEEAYCRHPEIEEEEIVAPILIIGQGRSGTSAILNLLAADPHNAVVRSWEAMVPGAVVGGDDAARRIEQADERLKMWGSVTPEINALHEFAGDVPTENIQFEALSFMCPSWQALLGQNPSHYIYVAAQSRVPCLTYGKRFLKLLQWRNPGRNWILKSNDSLNYLPDFFAVYPDARLVFMHRDPVKSISSMINLVFTLAYIRSDKALSEGAFREVTNAAACAKMLMQPVQAMKTGLLKPECLHNILYNDFVADSLHAVVGIYHKFDIALTPEREAALQRYLMQHPRSQRLTHQYGVGEPSMVTAEREVFREYQEHFNLASEV